MDKEKLKTYIAKKWDESIVAELSDYIKIPCQSPCFDKEWEKNRYFDQALDLMISWCKRQNLTGLSLEVVKLEKRTPLLLIEVAGNGKLKDETILLYGHLDKQPEMEGWDADKGPWKPVFKNDKLYGRGGADDGYAVFSAISAIKALQEQDISHARCVIIIEACEESGSYDLPAYLEDLKDRLGKPGLVICLDSGCGNYDQLWLTTSLRGFLAGKLNAHILTEGIHSGNGSGVVPSSFRILRQLLNRVEDANTGEILINALNTEIDSEIAAEAKKAAKVLGAGLKSSYPFVAGATAVSDEDDELVLNRTWRPSLSYIGMDGIPKSGVAGNVLRPYSSLNLSFRLPPSIDAKAIQNTVKETFEKDPPYQAEIKFELQSAVSGWVAPKLEKWLKECLSTASQNYFGNEEIYMGEGGSIPFMNILSNMFPSAQFVITGVLGPHSNAHGPNEFIHIPTAKKVTCCIAEVIEAFSSR